jgi:hypothetical protein
LAGWFEGRTETVNTTALPWDGSDRRLVSFVDYNHETLSTTDVALINLFDLYIQYDVQKGYNIHSLSKANVLVTQANDTMSRSVAIANLSMGQSFIYQKLGESDGSNGVVIDVCNTGSTNDKLDYSILSIYLNDGEQQSTCYHTENSTMPSTSPSSSFVSAVPSTFYSSVPSNVPTHAPSTLNSDVTTSAQPENKPIYIPSPSTSSVALGDGPASTDVSLTPRTSGIGNAYGHNLFYFSEARGVSTFLFLSPIALRYLVTSVFVYVGESVS